MLPLLNFMHTPDIDIQTAWRVETPEVEREWPRDARVVYTAYYGFCTY